MRTIKILITFGPSSVPIDEVRRITNQSTGSLGTTLVQYFIKKKHQVLALRGSGTVIPATFPFQTFNTNLDLHQSLEAISKKFQPDLLLHAAAMSDYEIDQIQLKDKRLLSASKISSSHSELILHLKPAPKILPQLRKWFPQSTIVSWKYELEGTSKSAIQKAQKQILQRYADYSVINGKAYGKGFGLCNATHQLHPHLDSLALAEKLLKLV